MNHKRNIGIIFGLAIILLVIYIAGSSYGLDDSYTGEFICENKVYMSDGSLNLVVYFNESSNTHYLIFEDWDAKHSVILSNLDNGERIEVHYKDYIFGSRKIVEIDLI